jgi:16S rRNA (adenine1518-N6/adenine1519-N6)-dimethyltransferase
MTQEHLPKKSLGQHWLRDEAILQAICEAGTITSDDTVLEVGPGTGTLTSELVRRAGHVIAVELDSTLAAELTNGQIAKNLQIVSGDIMKFDLTSLPPDYKVVANIPYYLTSNLIRVLSETPNKASTVVLLVQKEVAQRAAAQPGSMSLLSVSAQFYWKLHLGQIVPAKLFTPPPKVDSQVLILHRRDRLLFDNVDSKQFFHVVKAGYAARRKKLRSSLSAGLRISKEEATRMLAQAGINPDLRAQELSLEQWHQLYQQRKSQV